MLKFMVFGDLHYDDVSDGDRRLNELLVHIRTVQPDFVVSLGDLCKPVEQNRKKVLEKLNSAGVPIYHTIGNHETDINSLETVLEFLSIEKPYYSFEYDNIEFIVLDSCYFSVGGKEQHYYNRSHKAEGAVYPVIPSYELEWLKNELNVEKKCVIFSHHSFVNDFRDRGIYNRDIVRALFQKGNVLLCMNGHDHGDAFVTVNNIPYYAVNSASYMWCGVQINSSEKLREKYAYLDGMLLYKQALCVDIEIDNDEIRISGFEGEYLSVTPEDIELYDCRWNGVSVKPQTSSYVIKRK